MIYPDFHFLSIVVYSNHFPFPITKNFFLTFKYGCITLLISNSEYSHSPFASVCLFDIFESDDNNT